MEKTYRLYFHSAAHPMIKIGLLSDTHLHTVTDEFKENVHRAFNDCQVIIHAGDLTEISILAVFKNKEVHAVCGNCCNFLTHAALPEKKSVNIGGYMFGICHGAGNRINIEERMYDLFAEMDCIVFGHTHIPVCKTVGGILLINPGSFSSTGKYGAPGTYGIIEVTAGGMNAMIKHVEH